ncbi:DUF397 domain-containing protein [Streptomyces sp. Ru73]|uniref:DUF397 domain-containing protein n=1 Tax=Streptomyces sp. Ru73 TaxID=2080748 RepID=UPI000CDD9CF1|nr:DUF397 domain-containing protein [Streptomyces sp. Ru73]POX43108.1 DUF397 domain-containing protein [Streptomyces sp. Ru73]
MSAELTWFKSSHSGPSGGDCVEVALPTAADTVHVRDSKAIRGPEVRVSGASWRAFIAYAKGDQAR